MLGAPTPHPGVAAPMISDGGVLGRTYAHSWRSCALRQESGMCARAWPHLRPTTGVAAPVIRAASVFFYFLSRRSCAQSPCSCAEIHIYSKLVIFIWYLVIAETFALEIDLGSFP